MTETKRCSGIGRAGEGWGCEEEYPDHILPIDKFSTKNRGSSAKCKMWIGKFTTIHTTLITTRLDGRRTRAPELLKWNYVPCQPKSVRFLYAQHEGYNPESYTRKTYKARTSKDTERPQD